MSNNSSIFRLRLAHAVARGILYPVLYYVVRYRKRVVRNNLQIAFPNESKHRRLLWEKEFYRAFADMIMEMLAGRHIKEKDMQRFVHFDHLQEVADRCKHYGGGFFMLGHFLNWEWAVDYANQFAPYGLECASIYKQLSNRYFNDLILRIRQQRGGTLIEMDRLLRAMITNRRNNATVAYAMLADQRPRMKSVKYPVTFMGQSVDMLFGTEQLAKRFVYPVYYVSILSSERGHYELDFHLIYDPETEPDIAEGVITQRFTSHLEDNIRRNPSRWLWSHRRFLKLKKT